VIGMYEGSSNTIEDISRTGRRGLSKVAVALIALAGVLTLSGGVAWAMTNSALKDFFFKNSSEEFENVYTPVIAEYDLGNVKAVYEGSIYDKSTEIGYLSFSFRDNAGNPIILKNNNEVCFLNDSYTNDNMLSFHTFTNGLKIGDERFYLILINLDSCHTILDDNNLFVRFNRTYVPEDNKPFGFVVLSKEQFDALKADVAQLDPDAIFAYTYDPVTDTVTSDYDKTAVAPKVLEILGKYTINEVECIDTPAQEITVEDMKVKVGRTDITLIYNVNDCEIDAFTLIREDGTRIDFTKEEYTVGYNSATNEETTGNIWNVSEIDSDKRFGGGFQEKDGEATYTYNFGYILGLNEKVKIEANGNIYE
ncbi:MAG: hypothetical protein IKZ73_05320, partial [Lachnospiraceae bacterium]|nr:hypothetical protein [Lachnospiraceae bacterium]